MGVLPMPRHFHASSLLFKDKPNNSSKGEKKKSRFLKLDEDGNELKPEKKEKSSEEKAKLEAARAERELRKKETRAKQLEIQRKRDAASKKK